MILVPLLNPKFANPLQHDVCELRVRGTSRLPNFEDGLVVACPQPSRQSATHNGIKPGWEAS
jgi:hypothetical protein